MTCHEKMRYVNNKGQEILFGENGLYLDEVALSWKFEPNVSGNSIVSYSVGTDSFTLPVLIITDSDEEANAIRDYVHDVIFDDVFNNQTGTLYYRGYKLKCCLNESKNSDYQEHLAFGNMELTVSTDKPFWVKEQSHSFVFFNNGQELDDGIDFPFDYEHDYAIIENMGFFENDVVSDCDFVLKIQGNVSSPTVYIGGHMYSVDVTLSTGDVLIIDSKAKTIYIHQNTGAQINCFNARRRESYIFQKIPKGLNKIETFQSLSVEITSVEERGEPRWI